MKLSLALASLSLISVLGCSGKGDARSPFAEDRGKADSADGITRVGVLSFAEARTGSFEADDQYFGYPLEVRAGSAFSLEVTQLGTAADLDTVLWLVGPVDDDGSWTEIVAFDDDSGWGLHSRLRDVVVPLDGRYLVVVGTYDGTERGHYRLLAECASQDCAPTTAASSCPAGFQEAISDCVAELESDPENAPAGTDYDRAYFCSDAEVVAASFDSMCAGSSPPTGCAEGFASFYHRHRDVCASAVYNQRLDGRCALGDTFYTLIHETPAHLRISSDWRTTELADLDALARQQLVSAVHASSHADVTTAEEALDRIDQGQIRIVEVWDSSGARAFTAFEYGAGDNSYGKIFESGTTVSATEIHDGDFYGCSVMVGDQTRVCRADGECRGDLHCGAVAESGLGECLAD